jgi:hypothetical protein
MNRSRQTRFARSFTHITPSSKKGGGHIGSWENPIAEVARHHQQTPGAESEKRATSQMGGELSVRFREVIAEMDVLNSERLHRAESITLPNLFEPIPGQLARTWDSFMNHSSPSRQGTGLK